MYRAHKRRGRAAAAGVVLAVLLAACGGSGDSGDAEAAADGGSSSETSAVSETSAASAAVSSTIRPATTTAEPKEMPDVIGMTEAQATSELAKVGITDIRVQPQENLKKAGTVLEQVPRAGAVADEDVTANLIVATKLPPMPDYTNRTIGEVRSWFVDRGVEIRVTPVLRDDLPDGTILATTPAPNEPISGEVLMQVSEKPVTKQLSGERAVERDCDMNVDTGDMSVNGATIQNSITMRGGGLDSGVCALDYDLGRDWETFKATVGLDDSSAAAQSVRFEVFVDGNPAFNQTVGFGQTVDVNVDVKNALRIQLRVTDLAQGRYTAVFGNARVIGSASAATQASTTSTSR